MAETIKKAKAPAKTSKTAAEKPAAKKPTAVKAKASEPSRLHIVTEAEVASLAHQYWVERGHQHGNHVADWFRAEQELRSKAS